MIKANSYLASAPLRPYIKSYNFVEIDNSNLIHPVQFLLPEGSYEIIFLLQGQFKQIPSQSDEKWSVPPMTCLGGIFDIHYKIKPVGYCRFLRIQFHPGKFRCFHLNHLNECKNQMRQIDNPGMKTLLAFLEESGNTAQIESILNKLNALCESQLVSDCSEENELVLHAVSTIEYAKGMITIHELAENLKTSLSNLRKKFSHYVGISPKKYARIKRISHFIYEFIHTDNLNLTQLAHDMQYFDQSHFIRDVRGICGAPPGQLNQEKFSLQRALMQQ